LHSPKKFFPVLSVCWFRFLFDVAAEAIAAKRRETIFIDAENRINMSVENQLPQHI